MSLVKTESVGVDHMAGSGCFDLCVHLSVCHYRILYKVYLR